MSSGVEIHEFVIDRAEDEGKRLDVFLTECWPEISRSRLKALIEAGHVLVDKKPARASLRLRLHHTIAMHFPSPEPSEIQPQDLPLDILYEDADIIVLNKKAGMVVHPGAGHQEGTLVHGLLYRYPDLSVGDAHRPGLVHRLDKDTSGVMVCARHSKVHELLAVAFAERRVQKTYRAIVCGRFKEAHFELITGHARHPKDRKRFSTLFPSPETEKSSIRRAHSEFRVEGEGGGLSALTVHLHTGRTHQIRAHLSDVGHPLWGDTLYGGSKYRLAPQASSEIKKGARLLKRHALHAFELGLPNRSEANDKPFRAEMPEDFAALWRALVME